MLNKWVYIFLTMAVWFVIIGTVGAVIGMGGEVANGDIGYEETFWNGVHKQDLLINAPEAEYDALADKYYPSDAELNAIGTHTYRNIPGYNTYQLMGDKMDIIKQEILATDDYGAVSDILGDDYSAMRDAFIKSIGGMAYATNVATGNGALWGLLCGGVVGSAIGGILGWCSWKTIKRYISFAEAPRPDDNVNDDKLKTVKSRIKRLTYMSTYNLVVFIVALTICVLVYQENIARGVGIGVVAAAGVISMIFYSVECVVFFKTLSESSLFTHNPEEPLVPADTLVPEADATPAKLSDPAEARRRRRLVLHRLLREIEAHSCA